MVGGRLHRLTPSRALLGSCARLGCPLSLLDLFKRFLSRIEIKRRTIKVRPPVPFRSNSRDFQRRDINVKNETLCRLHQGPQFKLHATKTPTHKRPVSELGDPGPRPIIYHILNIHRHSLISGFDRLGDASSEEPCSRTTSFRYRERTCSEHEPPCLYLSHIAT